MKSFLMDVPGTLLAVLICLLSAPLFLICCLGVMLSNRRPFFVKTTDDQNRLTDVHFNFPRRGWLAGFCRETQLHLLPECWFAAAGRIGPSIVLRHMMEPSPKHR